MYIQEIEFKNFKSFCNDKIPLLKGITCITGPNGSGKSNFIDGFLFALGYPTFDNDNLNCINENETFVKVTFVEDNNTEFTIKRSAKREKNKIQSSYYCNDELVTLTQLLSELEKHNIKINELNIIRQGAIGNILRYSNTEIRKIIDKIADYDDKILLEQDKIQPIENEIKNLKTQKIKNEAKINEYLDYYQTKFINIYNEININFREIFKILSGKEASLYLENENNPLSGGIGFDFSFKQNTVLKYSMALAFILAIQKYQQCPFYIFDEIDSNFNHLTVKKLLSIIKEQSKTAQFIIVPRNYIFLSESDRLINVLKKEDGTSKINGIKLKE